MSLSAPRAALFGSVLALISGVTGALINGYFNRDIQKSAATSAIDVEATKGQSAIDLERLKFESTLILKALDTDDQSNAVKTLRFFANAGLIPTHEEKIRGLAEQDDGAAVPTLREQPSTGCRYRRKSLTYALLDFSRDIKKDRTREIVEEAFATWSAVSGLKFAEVSAEARPDFKLSWSPPEVGDLNTEYILAFSFPPPPCGGERSGEIFFNDKISWADSDTTDGVYLLPIALHEIGDALGLQHSSSPNSVSNPMLDEKRTKPSQEDIAAIQSLYGAPPAASR